MGDSVETGLSFSVLLEYAADDDVEGFKRSVFDESEISEVFLWYGLHRVSKKRVLEHRTPLMIAAKYGSLDVLKLILALPDIDVNFGSSPDKSTALHCAVSGGSVNAVDVVKLLLLSGADPSISDANGHLPADVIAVSPNFPRSKTALEELLRYNGSVLLPGKKEYPVDPCFPDIKNSVFTTDEFRMFAFKIQPCSRAYSHDWTECPYAHPGENARRRDPRKFFYSCVPCPDHKNGACRLGDFCDYSHGIFECWLHPAQYRTRLCKDGTSCTRRVCFFAHTLYELRPQAAAMDPNAGFDVRSGSPYFPFTPPMSPSSNDLSTPMAWHQQNISNFPRNSLNARDFPSDMVQDYKLQALQQLQILKELSFSSHLNRLNLSNTDSEIALPQSTDQLYKSIPYNPFHQQRMLSPIKTAISSPKIFETPQTAITPSVIAHNEKLQQQFGINGVNQWSKKPHSFENAGQAGQAHKPCFNEEEPDVSWVQSVLKESPYELEDSDSVEVSRAWL